MEVCSRSQDQHMKRTFDQRFLFWRREHKECGCHWTNRIVSMVYKSARPWTDIQLYGGFFLAYKDFGGSFVKSVPSCTFFFFFSMEISSPTPIPLFRPGSVHSGSVSLDDCGWAFPVELQVSWFSWWVPTLCLDSIVSGLQLCWVRGIVCSCVNCHPHF